MSTTNEFQIAYMKLRTQLDALVVNTLRYCMDGEDRDDCISRMAGIEGEILSLIGQVGGDAPCDDGYFNCGGVCVPYACVQDIMGQDAG